MEAMWKYFQWLATEDKIALSNKNMLVVSGCLQITVFNLMMTVLRTPKTSVLLMARDLAEKEWAGYNFWCSESIDSNCSAAQLNYHRKKEHSRTPEQFHESITYLAERTDTKRIANIKRHLPVHAHLLQDWSGNLSTYYKRIFTSFQSDSHADVLMLALPALDREPIKFLRRIITFLNLKPVASFLNSAVLGGAFHDTHVNEASAGLKVGTLFNETRALINARWNEDCLWLSEMTNYSFEACH
jgi:hypothetical protein